MIEARYFLSESASLFRTNSNRVIESFSLQLNSGQIYLFHGRNGSGKTTLLSFLCAPGIQSEGKVERLLPISRISYLPQMTDMDRSVPISVLDFLKWSAEIAKAPSLNKTELESLLGIYDLNVLKDRPLADLSGGEFQRVLLTRIELEDRDLVILDEPFNHLDDRSSEKLIERILHWRALGKCVVVSAHRELSRDLPNAIVHEIKNHKLLSPRVSYDISDSTLP